MSSATLASATYCWRAGFVSAWGGVALGEPHDRAGGAPLGRGDVPRRVITCRSSLGHVRAELGWALGVCCGVTGAACWAPRSVWVECLQLCPWSFTPDRLVFVIADTGAGSLVRQRQSWGSRWPVLDLLGGLLVTGRGGRHSCLAHGLGSWGGCGAWWAALSLTPLEFGGALLRAPFLGDGREPPHFFARWGFCWCVAPWPPRGLGRPASRRLLWRVRCGAPDGTVVGGFP